MLPTASDRRDVDRERDDGQTREKAGDVHDVDDVGAHVADQLALLRSELLARLDLTCPRRSERCGLI